jgi:hypothetical protein
MTSQAALLITSLMDEDPFCPAPPEEAAGTWSEQRIRAFFDHGGMDVQTLVGEQQQLLTREEESRTSEAKWDGEVLLVLKPEHTQVLAKFPPPSNETLCKWCPGLERCARASLAIKWRPACLFAFLAVQARVPPSHARLRSKTGCSTPRMRLVCFTNAGNEENVFTNDGLGTRRVSVLLDWCRASQVEVLAVQLPGRGARAKEPFLPDAQVCMRREGYPESVEAACCGFAYARSQTAAAEALAVLASRLCDAPYCVLAHSVGSWIAFEMLSLARELGLQLPLKVRDSKGIASAIIP